MVWTPSAACCLVVMVIFTSCLAMDTPGDFINEFTASVRGGDKEVKEVLRHLEKREAVRVMRTMNSNKFGHVVHFTHTDIERRSKRSLEDHPAIADLANHPYVQSIEHQRELIREKRDYYSQEKIAEARKVVQEYLDELEAKKRERENVPPSAEKSTEKSESGEVLSNIQHDKQKELGEPKFYEDKSSFHRFNVNKNLKDFRARDYDPAEDRYINLNDEHWPDQWYLNNLGQAGGPKGLDINVVPAWQQGFSGKGVAVCVLDDGIEHTHDDLKHNYWADISADMNSDDDNDPMPNPDNLDENSHGTRCAGEIAAAANNSVCGVGVAFNSRIGGIRILDGRVTDALEGEALLFENQKVDIYSASWGPKDDGKTMENPGKYCGAALEQGVNEGRDGKGSIFVWATGNGGYNGDDCGADGYVSSPYTLSIGSINNYAESTYFMESCASTMAVIYTGGYHSRAEAFGANEQTHPILKIVTTDVRNKCTLNFQGTSSAAPLAAGVMALALEANPSLTWRDLQHIVVLTSKIPNSIEEGWTINGNGLHINDKFGYGALDAAQMVQVAQTWNNVGPQHNCTVQAVMDENMPFDNNNLLEATLETDGCQKTPDDKVDKLEHVQLKIKLSASRRGDVNLTLISPAGTSSEMLSPRRKDASTEGIDFIFMTVRCWDEDPSGKWKLIVTDAQDQSETSEGGVLMSWSLTLLGTSSSTSTRDADRQHRKAYLPDKDKLNKLMGLESDAAVNVNIRKGSETDVIQRFASGNSPHTADTGGDGDGSDTDKDKGSQTAQDSLQENVEKLVSGMSKQKVQQLIDDLKDKVAEAKRIRTEKRDKADEEAPAQEVGSTTGQSTSLENTGITRLTNKIRQWNLCNHREDRDHPAHQ